MPLGAEDAAAARGHPHGPGPAGGAGRLGDPRPHPGGAAQPRQPRGGAPLMPTRRLRPSVTRTACLALAAGVAVLAGCGRNDPVRPDGAGPAESLPVLQAKSGGEMVLVPAGTFTMGDGAGRPDETPHSVSVRSFYLDRVPVTQELYEKVMGVNPSKRKAPKNPVERVQWTDAVRFCNRCSELEGLSPCYDLTTWECRFDADGYRLPTEAEWEYACRAGSTGKYCFGDAENELPRYAWLKPHSHGKPQPVGQKQPNRWGLYDMH